MKLLLINYSYILLLATLPIALFVYWISILKNWQVLGRIMGMGIIVVPAVFFIEYHQWLCQQPGRFCELIGFLYVLLSIEALILVLLFLGLGAIIQKSFKL